VSWTVPRPIAAAREGQAVAVADDGTITIGQPARQDVLTVTFPPQENERMLSGLRLEVPGGGRNFVVTRVAGSLVPPGSTSLPGRFVRVELPGDKKMLSLAEVQVFSGEENVALRGTATQSSTAYDGPARLAIDGNTNGDYFAAKSTTHTAVSTDPWWEVDLGETRPLDRIVLWNRTDNGLHTRLSQFVVQVLDAQRQVVWQERVAEPPHPSREFPLSGVRELPWASASADFAQPGFSPAAVLAATSDPEKGWAVAPRQGEPHQLLLTLNAPVAVPPGWSLVVTIEQLSKFDDYTLQAVRLAETADPRIAEQATYPADVVALLGRSAGERSAEEQGRLTEFYLSIAPSLADERRQLAELRQRVAQQKPYTTVPVLRELPEGQRRTTYLQHRGNFLDRGAAVAPGVPAVFPPLPEGAPLERLTLARWLVSPDNPLTARVIVNRLWEKIFGVGIVRTVEEFGSQGELPTHPELFDWLAVDFVESGWDVKRLLKLLVTSAAYRQSSAVTEELFARDPENRLLARGPRFRLTAEMVRDQALAVAGLLSPKLYGPPVRPPQPSLGLSAAFGSSTDWEPSPGEDRYRRALYIQWRRSNPYPSMSAFDAPNREVCTLRRDRSNTPLQALVTLNDPVYIEAAQALARRMHAHPGSIEEQTEYGFRLCLARLPRPAERERLVTLYHQSRERLAGTPAEAEKLATDPLGPLPQGSNPVELAAWTVVGNVLLNLDEMLMKR
jgi:hypothetical protein